jgi:hypothetical protein
VCTSSMDVEVAYGPEYPSFFRTLTFQHLGSHLAVFGSPSHTASRFLWNSCEAAEYAPWSIAQGLLKGLPCWAPELGLVAAIVKFHSDRKENGNILVHQKNGAVRLLSVVTPPWQRRPFRPQVAWFPLEPLG